MICATLESISVAQDLTQTKLRLYPLYGFRTPCKESALYSLHLCRCSREREMPCLTSKYKQNHGEAKTPHEPGEVS